MVRNASRRRTAGCVLVVLLMLACVGGIALLSSLLFIRGEDRVAGRAPVETTIVETVEAEGGQPSPEGALATVEEVVPDAESPSGRIVYVDEEGQLATIDSGGSDARVVSAESERVYLFPAWSPDGTRLAAIGADDDSAGVYILVDGAGEEVVELYASQSGAPIYLYWRPDGNAVTFIASGANTLQLYLSATDGRSDPRLLIEGQPLYWDWLDAQSRLFAHTGSPLGGATLTLIETERGPISEPELDNPGFFQAPAVSPGGIYLAFAELNGAERTIAVQNLSTDDVQRLPHDGAVAMSWSPVEQKLAFIHPDADDLRPGQDISFYGPLRLFDAETGDVSTLVDDGVLAFFWAPDGQKIAYFTLSSGAGEQVAQARSHGPGSVQGKVRQQHEGVFLNLSLVDLSGSQARSLLDFQPTELFLTQFLPFFDQYARSHALWSPESDALVLPIVDDGESRIFVVSANSGPVRAIARGAIAFWSPR